MKKVEDVGVYEIFKIDDPEFGGTGYIVMDGLVEIGASKTLDGARTIAENS